MAFTYVYPKDKNWINENALNSLHIIDSLPLPRLQIFTIKLFIQRSMPYPCIDALVLFHVFFLSTQCHNPNQCWAIEDQAKTWTQPPVPIMSEAYTYIHTYTYTCTYINIYIHTYTYTYIYIYTYTYGWTEILVMSCWFSPVTIGRISMMTSSNGKIFRVTGHLCGEFTGHRWIPLSKASVAELWYFLWSAPE